MLSIKEFNKKLVSLKNTRKMTKTMKMVSASKFKRAYKAQSSAMVYARKIKELMGRLAAAAANGGAHPFFATKSQAKKILFIVVTSDKGMAGGFNNYLIRYIKAWLKEYQSKYEQILFSFCGRKGYAALNRHVTVAHYYENITVKPNIEDALKLAEDIRKAFLSKEVDEVYLAYNKFNNPMSQTPVIEKVLPLDPKVLMSMDDAQKKAHIDYKYEPEEEFLIAFLIDKYLNFKIFYTLLENAAGEHGARMTAMDKASQNTSELIEKNTLLRNRARQAAITTELIEIISGAEALK